MGLAYSGFHLEKVSLRLGVCNVEKWSSVYCCVTTLKLSGITQQLFFCSQMYSLGRTWQDGLISAPQAQLGFCQVGQENSLPTWLIQHGWQVSAGWWLGVQPEASVYDIGLMGLPSWVSSQHDNWVLRMIVLRDRRYKLLILWGLGPEAIMASLLSYLYWSSSNGLFSFKWRGHRCDERSVTPNQPWDTFFVKHLIRWLIKSHQSWNHVELTSSCFMFS